MHNMFRILECNPFPVCQTNRQKIEEVPGFHNGRMQVVRREHDSLGFHLKEQVQEERSEVEAANRVADVITQN